MKKNSLSVVLFVCLWQGQRSKVKSQKILFSKMFKSQRHVVLDGFKGQKN
jgi:hypothetical protein